MISNRCSRSGEVWNQQKQTKPTKLKLKPNQTKANQTNPEQKINKQKKSTNQNARGTVFPVRCPTSVDRSVRFRRYPHAYEGETNAQTKQRDIQYKTKQDQTSL